MGAKAGGFPLLLVGGNANNGTNDGPFYWNWNNNAGNSNWNISGRPPLLILQVRSISAHEPHPLVKIIAACESGSGTRRSRETETPRWQERTEKMPHRIGNLWDIFVSEENCIRAEIIMGENRPDNRMAQYIKRNPEKFGRSLSEKLKAGYSFHAPRERDIKDSYKGKTRHLKISCLEDVAAQQAWLNVAVPHIEKRNYYYNCGSIPGAGQTRAVDGMKKVLRGKKAPKWAATTDIRKFYDSCPHKAVMDGLRKIFKDDWFLEFAAQILANMSGNGIGIAIGFPVSHWFANVALMGLDHDMRRKFPGVIHFRYMDDVPFLSRNKRYLRQAIKYFMDRILEIGMEVKRNWQIFRIEIRGIQFLSYRFFIGYTLLTKRLMIRIARKMRKAGKRITAKLARGIMSYLGILKYCDSQNFKRNRVYPFVNIKACRKLISEDDKTKNERRKAA